MMKKIQKIKLEQKLENYLLLEDANAFPGL